MSKQTPPQRHQSPHLITLYRNLLVSYSDASNIERLEFPFHTQRGRGDRREADRGEDTQGQRKRGKSQRTVGLRGNKHIRHPGRETHEQGWRERGRNRERAPTGKARSV